MVLLIKVWVSLLAISLLGLLLPDRWAAWVWDHFVKYLYAVSAFALVAAFVAAVWLAPS